MDNSSPIFLVDPILYDINSLIISSLILFIFSFFFGKLVFKSIPISLSVAFIKTGFYLIFFLFFFNKNNFAFPDAITYARDVKFLFENYTLIELILNSQQTIILFSQGHPFYYYWSYVSFLVFGSYIHSPIVLNILSTFLGSYYIYKISSKYFYISNKNSILLSVIYCLHWEVLPWSSFFNLRDILIQVNILALIYYLLKIFNRLRLNIIIKLAITLFILKYLRQHLVYIFFLTVFLITFLNLKKINLKIYLIIFFSMLCVFLYNLKYFYLLFQNWYERFDFNYGIEIIRLLLSPLPNVQTVYNGYGFLVIGSIINIITLPFLLLGIIYSFKNNLRNAFILFIFFLTILFVIGSYDNVQGPRQRLMISTIILLYTFLGFISVKSKNTIKYFQR
jgi:hypothetical protein